ncbi:MAG: hypothetical protein VXW29_01685, partial [SAR324 cluster bacterium]|nr:hypothetical protein [SAR324 cluster bacterium]
LSGLKTDDGRFSILTSLHVEKQFPVNITGEYEYVAQTSDGNQYRGFFDLIQIAHSKDKGFKFIIPTQNPLRILQIFQTIDGQEVFSKDYGAPIAQNFTVELEQLGEGKWKIPATNRGQRIIRRMENQPEILVFDNDNRDRIIEGTEGEFIEIQYQLEAGRVEKILIKLQ